MELSTQDVRDIAKLAKLQINEDELDRYKQDLSRILEFVEQMNLADVDNIEPMADNTRYHITDMNFTNDKKIMITTSNNKQIIQRFYNEFSKTMEIESVKNYKYSVNHLLAHETPMNESHFPAQP